MKVNPYGIPMNLQLFGNGDGADLGGGAVSTETGGNAASTIDRSYMSGGFDDTSIKLVGENEGLEKPKPTESVAASTKEVDNKQDPKIDKAFATLRKEREAFEKELNQYKQYDAWVKENFGVSSLAEYKEKMEQQLREQKEAELKEAGYDPEMIKEVLKLDPNIKKLIEQQNTEIDTEAKESAEAQKQAEADMKVVEEYKSLASEFPGLIKQPEDIQPQVWELYDKGMSLSQAYAAVNYKAILEHGQTVGQQKALNKINSKSHLKVEGDGAGEGNDTYMPEETLRMYQDMGMNREQAFKHFKKLYG